MHDAPHGQIEEEISKLPKAHQQAINAFDWRKKCQQVGASHKLLENEITGLQAEVALVLMGLSDMATLHRYIDCEIGGTGWQEIETFIVDNVLQPISEIMSIIVEHDG
jgi:hypothetical protein